MSSSRPPNQLLSSLWKLDRAEILLGELRQGLSVLARTAEYAGLTADEPVSTATRAWLVGWAYPAPFRFYGVVADFVHNLRAALDHLAWQLCGCPDPERRKLRFRFTRGVRLRCLTSIA